MGWQKQSPRYIVAFRLLSSLVVALDWHTMNKEVQHRSSKCEPRLHVSWHTNERRRKVGGLSLLIQILAQ